MELIKEKSVIGEVVFSDCLEVASSGDLIVPDVKPDILKVLQVDSDVCVENKRITDSRLELSGKFHLTVLYLADNDYREVQAIHTCFDFEHRLDRAVIDNESKVIVDAEVSGVDYHIINSRKLSLKTEAKIDYRIYKEKCVEVVTATNDECVVEACRSGVEINSLCGIKEDEFIVKETVEIPSGKASIGEILKLDYKICDGEERIVSQKVISKAVLNISILYSDTNQKLEYAGWELPFTEVFDFPDVFEDAWLDASYSIKSCEHFVSQDNDGDNRLVTIDIVGKAQMRATKKKEITAISDCFCPGYKTQLEFNEFTLLEEITAPKVRTALRDVVAVDGDMPILSAVYNVITTPIVEDTILGEGKLSVKGKIDTTALYISENADSPLFSVKKEIPFDVVLDTPVCKEKTTLAVKAEVSHTSYHVNMANEIEIRCILDVVANLSSTKEMRLLRDVEYSKIPESEKKGMVIYFVQPEDTLWDIAKGYSVATNSILEFNKLSRDDEIRKGQRLVIPIQ